MKAPHFWNQKNILSSLLIPAAWLYRLAGWLRALIVRPYRSSLPVICVGNITSGGTGKTPVTAYLAKLAKSQGLAPVILSRGYGGTITTPTFVDPEQHDARLCGDEPLLLSQSAPVLIARHRGEGARFIEAQNRFDIIIMDDGMQNPQLHKDSVIAVFDGKIGIQNGRIFPAGPLRTSLSQGRAQADIMMMNGADDTSLLVHPYDKSALFFHLKAEAAIPVIKKTTPLFAFAGIGRPERFFETLANEGYYLAQTKAFGDHHGYNQDDITALVEGARALSALLITTQKDWVRLPPAIQKHIAYLPVSLHISATDEAILAAHLNANR